MSLCTKDLDRAEQLEFCIENGMRTSLHVAEDVVHKWQSHVNRMVFIKATGGQANITAALQILIAPPYAGEIFVEY
jgi:hypothetical protein